MLSHWFLQTGCATNFSSARPYALTPSVFLKGKANNLVIGLARNEQWPVSSGRRVEVIIVLERSLEMRMFEEWTTVAARAMALSKPQ
jgi:hypothetical protein